MKIKTEELHSKFSEQIFSNKQIGLILLDCHGYIVKLTQMAASILGDNVMNYKNKNIFTLFEHLDEDRQIIPKNVINGVALRNKAMQWHNGEQQFELLIDTYPIVSDQGDMLGTSIFIKDVSNVRSLENKIRRNERLAMVGQMAAGTAHEIRNPLTSIKGFLQMLNNSLKDLNRKKELEYIDVMLEEIERINHLVGEFLLLSRSREGIYEKIKVSHLLKQVLPIVKSEAMMHGIEVKTTSGTDDPTIMGDKKLLKQVCLNLCKNAIEAMGNEGTLTIGYQTDKKNDMVSIDFKDTGPGIPAYVADKIFEPFFTTKDGGTGLGLAVCQRIIHDMGGKISITTKGYGTTFHVQIPFVHV